MRYLIKKVSYVFLFSFLILAFIGFLSVPAAHAMTPTLSLAATGDGDSVQMTVNGDPNSSVLFVYIKSGTGQQITSVGTTNGSGNLTTTISSSSYGVPSGSSVYVIVGGLNGTQSSTTTWPQVSSLLSSSNMLTLSQTGLVLSVGGSSTITAGNMNNSSLYLNNNSNPVIANFNISGSQITVYANGYGTTTGRFCLVNNTSNCSSVYVTVQNGNVQSLSFSQSSVSMSSGQTVSIQISGGTAPYSVLSNASQNGGLVTTSISGSVVTLTTQSTSGSSSITVCSSNQSACGIINVTIGTTSSTTAMSFSQTNPTVTVGQNLTVSVYGPASSLYYVSSNSNPAIVQANLSGSTLTLMGIASGTSTISICAASNNCGSMTVTVNPNYSSSASSITLSQDNVSLAIGQSANVTISGGSMPYSTLMTPNNVFQASINTNIMTIYGIGAGSSSVSVCSNGSCASVIVTVGSSGQYSNTSTSTNTSTITNPITTNTMTSLPSGCASVVGYSNTTGLACNGTSVATPVPADCTGALYSVSTGLVCPAYTVNTNSTTNTNTTPATSTSSTSTITSTPATTASSYRFTEYLKLGSKGTEVTELQKKLKKLGYFNAIATGYFGTVTQNAVKAFQKAKGISQVGTVGPITRTALNKN